METEAIPEGHSQADFIKDLSFDVDPEDPLTKAALQDHPEDVWIDILGNGQLRKKTLVKGEKGLRPNRNDLCKLNITGKLMDSGKIVEQHIRKTVQLGDVELVQGLDLAIALMEVGERAEIEVASRFAYGEFGLLPDVPPDATILYDVELISMEIETEIESMNFEQRRAIGNKKRERGNWWFWRDEYTLAIQCWRRSLDFLNATQSSPSSGASGEPEATKSSEDSMSDSELQVLLEDRMKVYNNLAAAQIKIHAYDAALESAENVLRCQPQNVKALFRKGKSLDKKGDHAKALSTFLLAEKLEPDSKMVKKEIALLKKKTAKDTLYEKNLYKKMLGSPKHTENATGRKDTLAECVNSKSSTKIAAWTLLGGAVAALAGAIAYRYAF